jgi:hypothetical protein
MLGTLVVLSAAPLFQGPVSAQTSLSPAAATAETNATPAALPDDIREELRRSTALLESLRARVDELANSVEAVARIQHDMRSAVDNLKGSGLRDWIPLIATLVTAVVALYSLWSNNAISEAGLRERLREEERRSIREKIDQFYGPFFVLRRQSETLYRTLFLTRRSEDERARYSDSEGNFRTVFALSDGHRFEGLDKALIDQFVVLGEQTSDLIRTKLGLVDDKELQSVLAKATAHFFVLKLLADGTLPGGGQEFEALVFPHDLENSIS